MTQNWLVEHHVQCLQNQMNKNNDILQHCSNNFEYEL